MPIIKTIRRIMLDHAKHRAALIGILKDVYSDPFLRTLLGFKGGTAAMLFYDLPRISVDLDFNVLDEQKKQLIFEKVKAILPDHGTIREATEKRYTLFFLISYEKGQHTIKIEISKRKGTGEFHMKQYLGVSVLVMKESDMAAGKLAALVTRRVFAMRDVFDIWFFLKQQWTINESVLKDQADLSLPQAIDRAIDLIRAITPNELLRGLGELLDPKQKSWAKDHLIEDTIFHLRLYKESTT